MWEDEKKKKSKIKKGEQWGASDILFGIFGFVALIALAIAGFQVAKWVMSIIKGYI